MTHNTQKTPTEPIKPFYTSEFKMGNTTYVVNSFHSPNAREGLLDILWRLIRNDTPE
jgi:hypothetical protein